MRQFRAMLLKEWMEQIRTYKLFIMACSFFLLGIMNPIIAKVMPEIMSGSTIQGLTIIVPKAVVMDSYIQFFKNVGQFGVVMLLLIFSGTLSSEFSHNTLINILSKGLKRSTIILAKYSAAVSLWTFSYLIASLVHVAYTMWLFPGQSVQHIFLSFTALWLFGCFLLAVISLSGSISGSYPGGLLITVTILGLLLVLNLFTSLQNVNPLYLAGCNTSVLAGDVTVKELLPSALISFGMIPICLWISVFLFNKKKL